jgi:hypothetical protein
MRFLSEQSGYALNFPDPAKKAADGSSPVAFTPLSFDLQGLDGLGC